MAKYRENGFTFDVRPSGEVELCTFHNSQAGTISIPNDFQGMPVVRIHGRAFHGCTKMTSLVIPPSIRDIGVRAFDCCIELKTISCHSPQLKVREAAFSRCFKLTAFKFKDNSRLIIDGPSIFERCGNLTHIGAEICGVIADNTFCECKRLTELSFGQNVYLQTNAFKGCQSLTDLHFQASASIDDRTLPFVKKRTIHCPQNSNLVALAYEGVNVVIDKNPIS